ncbi:MAG: hypothetical protein AcusKO_14450 [Acuticoccus sp.]
MFADRLAISCIAATLGLFVASSNDSVLAQDQNACPVDGCIISITSVEKKGDELEVTFEANFTPDFSKNHIHIWWGELFDVKQVSNNAETVHGMTQGSWHPTDEFPVYVTQSAASVGERGEATSLCVSAADRNHDILDPNLFECTSVAGHLE